MEYEQIEVECHDGYKDQKYPVSFMFQGSRRHVAEILDRWYEGGLAPERPAIDYFRIRTKEGRVFILMYARDPDEWFIRF